MAKKNQKQSEKTEFVKLIDGGTVSGTYQNFGKNQYGTYIVLLSEGKKIAVNLQATVLRNLIKLNIEKFIDNENKIEVEIHREGKKAGKKYVVYSVFVNGDELKTIQMELTANDVKNLLD